MPPQISAKSLPSYPCCTESGVADRIVAPHGPRRDKHHSVPQQLCRWRLFVLDRLPDNKLMMTQGLIANMPGVRREGVTDATSVLQSEIQQRQLHGH